MLGKVAVDGDTILRLSQMLSSSTPYSRLWFMLSGSIPKKLPTPQAGSSTFPSRKPMLSKASYIALITTGLV